MNRVRVIVTGVIISLILAIVIAVAIVVTKGSNDNSDTVDLSNVLIISDKANLWALNLNNNKKTILLKTKNGITAFDLFKKYTIYFSEIGSNQVYSLSKKYHNLIQARKWDPQAISVDFITENVYVLDKLGKKLNIHSIKHGNYGIAVSDLKNPKDMQLDHSRGLIFILQKCDSILKGHMDGTAFKKIVSSSTLTVFSLDIQASRLYWVDEMNIKSSDYNGENHLTVTQTFGRITSLAVSSSRLFWVGSMGTSNFRSLWTCIMTSNYCNKNDFQKLPFDNPDTIKTYTEDILAINNPCQKDNGGCEQLCLQTINSGYSCSCYIGYQFESESKSCKPVKEYLLYTRGNFIRGKIFDNDKEAFSDAILPIYIQTNLYDKKIIDFDYNFHTSTFIFTDDQFVTSIDLMNEKNSGSYSRNKCLKGVSVDWVTNDIYYVKDNCATGENTTIVVLRPKENNYFWKTLKTFNSGVGHPQSLVVDPNTGCYFFTMRREDDVQIHKVHGLKTTQFVHETISINETGLTIDSIEDRLYWFNKEGTSLVSANLNGTDFKSINISLIREPRSISIHGNYAYISNLTSIWRIDKTGTEIKRFAPNFEDDTRELIAGVRIFSSYVQKVKVNDHCAIENGDCQQFCFRTPKMVVSGPNMINTTDEVKKICQCEDHKTILSDGKSCAMVESEM